MGHYCVTIQLDLFTFMIIFNLFYITLKTQQTVNVNFLHGWNNEYWFLWSYSGWVEAVLLFKPFSVISKGVRVFRLMQLLKNKREAVAIAVSEEWWLMIHAKYINNPNWSKMSVYDLEILFAFYWAHLLMFLHNIKWCNIKKLSARNPQETQMWNKFLISSLSSQQRITKFIETAKLPLLIYSLDTILLAQIIQILCLHLLMSSSLPLKYFITILN